MNIPTNLNPTNPTKTNVIQPTIMKNMKNMKRKNSPIPTKLKITIETNLPEFKKFRYDPQLSLPYAPSHNVYFNPLQPLNEKIIKKISKRTRLLTFFNSQMFHKLNKYTSLFRSPIPSLQIASEIGNVDHNIETTLETLFSTNNVFYINREKYYIEFFEWQTGNWVLETEEPNKYTEEELYGPNFRKPQDFISLRNSRKLRNGNWFKNLFSPSSSLKKEQNPTAPPMSKQDNFEDFENKDPRSNLEGGRTRKYYFYPNQRIRNRTFKRFKKPIIKKYHRGSHYKIQIFISLKKGEKVTDEELKKIPCKKKWKGIVQSFSSTK